MIKNLKSVGGSDDDKKKSKNVTYDINPDFGFSTVPDIMDNPMNDSPLRDQYRTAYLRWSSKPRSSGEFGVDNNTGGLLSPPPNQQGKSTNPLTLRSSPNPNMRYTPKAPTTTSSTNTTSAPAVSTTSYEEQQIRLQMQQMNLKLPKFLTEHLDNKDSTKKSSGGEL